MKILTEKQYNDLIKLAEVAEKTSRDIYDRIEELERRIGRLEFERYRPPTNTPVNPSWPIAPQPTVYTTAQTLEGVTE